MVSSLWVRWIREECFSKLLRETKQKTVTRRRGDAENVKTSSASPRLRVKTLVDELAAVADVVGEDVFAEAVGRRVERASSIDLRELLDEVHQHRIGGQHERRDRDIRAAAAVRFFQRPVHDLHVEAE